MFKQVILTKFRQHRDLTINFERGVIALRGANEAGKTTILEAIAYALFGANALREPLSETVTWGEKESALKVNVTFELAGVEYSVRRSKSGAEIKVGAELRATGQTEVRKYVENLLGGTAEVCTNLMLANQSALRGTLSKGPSAAIELIEALSNFSLIDNVIAMAQAKLPSGTTVSVESRIQMLEQQTADPVLDETGPLQLALQKAEENENSFRRTRDVGKEAYTTVQPAAREAQQRLQAFAQAQALFSGAASRLDAAFATLKRITLPAVVDDKTLAELRQQAADATRLQRAVQALTACRALPEPENEWEGPYESLLAEKKTHDEVLASQIALKQATEVKIAQLEAQRITGTACGLCGKDLRNVPEVVSKNLALDQQIEAQAAILQAATDEAEAAMGMVEACAGILRHHTARAAVYGRWSEFISLDTNYVPHRWSWAGPESLEVQGDPAKALAAAEAGVRAYQQALGQRQQAEAHRDQCEQAYQTALQTLQAAQETAAGQQEVLDKAAALTAALNDVEMALRQAQEATKTARNTLSSAKALLEERQRARKALEAQLAAARAELAEMDDNNALIRALREARPQVSDELWGIVSGTVSRYFSDIRGVPSVLTREGNSFKVDGQSIGGLSGSTLDALGLAIRVALTKTFLPNTNFLILDEPAAAADEQRESNMLGLLATCEFEQVLLITHSDLADSFATQVVRL